MILQTVLFIALSAYLAALAIAFHKLLFEVDKNIIIKLGWAALLIIIPLAGIILFYSAKHEYREQSFFKPERSIALRLLKSFVYAALIFGIILLVFWILNRK